MRVLSENTDILLEEGYNEFVISADRDIEISLRTSTASEAFVRIEKAKNIKIHSFTYENAKATYLFWNETSTKITFDENYTVLKDGDLTVAYGECNDASSDHNAYVSLIGKNAKALVTSALLVKDHKNLNLEVVNIGDHTSGKIENYAVVLKDGKLMIDAIGKIVKGAYKSESHQASRAMSFADGQSTTILPELLIDENDVQASHAMSIGRVDENQLYYMMSRGLSVDACTALISTGYLMPITRIIHDTKIKETLEKEMERKIAELC